MQRQPILIAKRPVDIVILIFFVASILFITYIVDLEQLVIADPTHFVYKLWPPHPAVDAIHWRGNAFDHGLIARPAWWKMTIWIDNLGFGPFYLVAIYAYITGKEWIRIPSIIYPTMLLTNVLIILGEEYAGAYASPHFPIVLLANLPWLVFPLLIIYRMARHGHPFTQPQPAPAVAAPHPGAGAVQ